jgi:hypothetical protein
MSILTKIIDFIVGKLPRNSAQVLKYNGDIPISYIEIKRSPISRAINLLLNIISKGEFEKYKRSVNYDDYYHLRMICYLQNGKRILVEKNQNINISTTIREEDKTETIRVSSYKPNTLTLNMMFQNADKKINSDRLYRYSIKNNCQQFINDLLNSSNINNSEVNKFIMQDIGNLIPKLPEYTKFISQLSTDIAGYTDKIFQWLRIYKKGGTVNNDKYDIKFTNDPYGGIRYKKGEMRRRTRDYTDEKYPAMVKVKKPSKIEKKNIDRIPALLVAGEMIIPKKYVPQVKKFLKSQNIKLNGM